MILKARVSIMLFSILFVGLSACNNQTNGDNTDSQDTVINAETVEGENKIVNDVVVNDLDSIPNQLKYEGKVVDSKIWRDKSGEHYIIITENKQGEYLTETWVSKLNGYMYTKAGNDFRADWQVNDSANISPEINYKSKSLSVKDIDGDGEAEFWFFYSINEDGADPMPLKMNLHSKGQNLAITGVIPRSISDLSLYKKTVDAKGILKVIEDYASKEWDKVATDEMKKIIGEDVIQSKDFPIRNN